MFEKQRKDYEARIESLQKQVDAQSMMSSMYSSMYSGLPEKDFDDYGKSHENTLDKKNVVKMLLSGVWLN